MALEPVLKPVLVVWASRTGNTALLAERITEVLAAREIPVERQQVKDVNWEQLDQWSALVLGSPTHGSGDLHADWDQPERRLRDADLTGLWGAAFGCGNPRYPTAWWAVDILDNRLKNQGARRLGAPYKADTQTALRVRDADRWIEELADAWEEAFGLRA